MVNMVPSSIRTSVARAYSHGSIAALESSTIHNVYNK